MAACAYCGAETQLYNGGVPICLTCADRHETKAKADHIPDVRAILARDLTGTLRIHDASRALSAARDEMMIAHNRLNNFLSRGIVPEDLER